MQSQWISVASHASGVGGSQWRTDLGILNLGAASANIELRFIQGAAVKTSTAFVAPGSQSILVDVVGQLGASGSGALEVRSDQAVKVTSRTYNQSANGTFGQNYRAFRTSEGLNASTPAWLPQLTENGAYRTNIGVTNTSNDNAGVAVTLFDGAGAQVGTYTVNLLPGEWKQENRPFATKAGQTDLSRGFARITVSSGNGVFAYASVVDNVTSDPTTVEMVR
jgi:hypothetical protein